MSELAWASLREIGALIKSKQISSRELVAEHLDNVEAMNPTVNAIVTIDVERSLTEAACADELLAGGTHLGPLHGIPAAFKDSHETAGMRTTFGSPLYEHHVPDQDDITVARMRSAGAITIGKTNIPEFATGCNTFNPLFGATRNPYDVGRAAGGSSGGSAAALITGMAATCEGSDLGGSLRNPASFCNVVGLRPTPGRVPDLPAQFAWQTLHVRGPMGRTVDDVAILLSVISGPDARNPISLDADGSAFANIAPADLRGLRVAWAPTLGGIVDVDQDILETLRPQLATFESLGCIVEEACINFDGADAAFRTLRAWTFAYALNDLYRQHRDRLKPSLAWSIEEGHLLSGRDIGAAIESHAAIYQNAREFFETYDVLLTPGAQVVPFDIDLEYPTVIAGHSSDDYLDCLRIGYNVTMTGCPALSVPAGFTGDGLPVGLQMVGRHRGEEQLLAIAKTFEDATRFSQRLPDLDALRTTGAANAAAHRPTPK